MHHIGDYLEMSLDKGAACGSLDKAQAWCQMDYEVQTGIIAEPTTASVGNGHPVVVYNSTEGRTFLWLRVNGDAEWMGCEFL